MADDLDTSSLAHGLARDFDETERRADALSRRLFDLQINTKAFSSTMSGALVSAVSGSKQLDDVFKSLVLRLSDLTLKSALTPLTSGIASGLQGLLGSLTGGGTSMRLGAAAAQDAIKPFAAGGVIGTPTYFPLASGGLGLAGEAGPEAIVPLSRAADGRLGIAGGGGGTTQVTVNIAARDPASFRGSEVYLTGQIARAVARGRRGM